MVSSRLTWRRRTHGSTLQDPTCGSQALMAWLRYQSQNHSPSQGQEHGHLLPLERRFPLGHASVPLLEYALMALLSTLVIIF